VCGGEATLLSLYMLFELPLRKNDCLKKEYTNLNVLRRLGKLGCCIQQPKMRVGVKKK
jgi:hypothetical protein